MNTLRPGISERMRLSLQARGPVETARHYCGVLWQMAKRHTPKELKRARDQRNLDRYYEQKRAAIDSSFDGRYGVDTAAEDLIGHSIVGPNRWEGTAYHGVNPDLFLPAVESLKIKPEDWTFVDIGAGKGRALMMAQMQGFRRCIGIEYSQDLFGVCVQNLAAFSERHPELPPAEVLCMDAIEYELPGDPLVIFFYHPFGDSVMKDVAQRIQDATSSRSNPIRIIYVNPVCDETLSSTAVSLRRLSEVESVIIYAWDPKSRSTRH